MNVEHLLTIDATVTTVTNTATRDVYGDITTETSTTSVKCWLHQGTGAQGTTGGSEQTGLADTQRERWTAYFPAGTAITGHDRVTVGSDEYEVFGPPWSATNPRTGQVEFVTAQLVRVT